MTEMTTEAAMAWLFRMAARAPANIAPERQAELSDVVFRNGPISLLPSSQAALFSAVPNKAIYASWAGQASLWCLSFAAFQIMDVTTRVARGSSSDAERVIDFGSVFAALKIDDYVRYSRTLFKVDGPWPSHLEKPFEDPPQGSEEWCVNNLYLGALAWVLLHEIGHIHHDDQKFVPVDLSLQQEYRADTFATQWILSAAGNGIQREYRVLAIVVGLAWLFLNEAELGPCSDHPAAISRFKEVIQHFDVGTRSVALESAAYVLKALFDPESVPPQFDTAIEAFDWVADRLDSRRGSSRQISGTGAN